MTQNVTINVTAEQAATAEKAAQSLEALIHRLEFDAAFSAALKQNPRQALSDAGLSLEKESMETLMVVDPQRFDSACESLFGLVDSDFLISMSHSSCG